MPLRFLTIAYIDVFRAVPLLIIILLISGGLPFLSSSPKTSGSPTGSASRIPSGTASLALLIVYGAYMPRSTGPGSKRSRAARWRRPARSA